MNESNTPSAPNDLDEWSKLGVDVKVGTWEELISTLHGANLIPQRLSEGGHFRSPYVFRGSDKTWPLNTSLQRLAKEDPSKIQLLERALVRSFRKYASAGLFDDKSEWHVLAVGQHNGLPTRCLDWSSSPLVAAHFACANSQLRADSGCIWCLHAGTLLKINNSTGTGVGRQIKGAWVYDTKLLESSFEDLDSLDQTFDHRRPTTRTLLLWEPPSLDARIANQAGLLSLMNSADGSQDDFLYEYTKSHSDLIRRIIILPSAKSEIRDMLDQNNISERMLFPGLPGLCDWLKRYYGKAW